MHFKTKLCFFCRNNHLFLEKKIITHRYPYLHKLTSTCYKDQIYESVKDGNVKQIEKFSFFK